jgi:hypothetical protein
VSADRALSRYLAGIPQSQNSGQIFLDFRWKWQSLDFANRPLDGVRCSVQAEGTMLPDGIAGFCASMLGLPQATGFTITFNQGAQATFATSKGLPSWDPLYTSPSADVPLGQPF